MACIREKMPDGWQMIFKGGLKFQPEKTET